MFQRNVRVFSERLVLVTIIPAQMEGIIELDPSSHACKHYIFHLCFRSRDILWHFSHPSIFNPFFSLKKIRKKELSKHKKCMQQLGKSFFIDLGNKTTKSLCHALIPPLFFSVWVLLTQKQPRTLSAGQVTFETSLSLI